ncbi:MAG: hypothetical protein SNI05_02800 [Rikenellaceae bacterium]
MSTCFLCFRGCNTPNLIDEIDELYSSFVSERGYEPLHVMCVVKHTHDGSPDDYTIALRPDTGEFADFYCESLEHFKQLTEPNDEPFIVVECEDFID